MSTRVLIVDDDHDELQVASRVLVKEGHIVAAADSARTALEMLATERADVIVSDVDMPGMGGLEFMREVRARFGTQLVVMMSGLGSVEVAVEAVQEGAIDFLTKPIDFDRLRSTVSRAIAAKGPSPELGLSIPTVTAQPNLVGEGPLMLSLKRLIHQVAPSDCRVLIQGENGTGKELIANAIHAGSRRRNNPFVKVNCGALTSTLLESELFGHEKGAFTGATTRRRGRFEVAHTGTLLLDEIGELSLDAQVRLLRVIQEGEFERVGGSQTLRCDVRILAATNQDLAEMVTRGKFREDLYYRLNVVTIEAPALRNRRSDIPLLVDHILGGLGAQNRIKFSQGAMERLMARSYPGNVRELQNIVERLSVLLPGEEILSQHLDELVPSPLSAHLSGQPLLLSPPASYQPGVSYRDRLLQLERDLIVQALEAHGGSKSAAAQALGTDKSFFYRKCRQFGVN
jgi:two-component system response regulator HydG